MAWYSRAMRTLLIVATMLIGMGHPAFAQPVATIKLAVDIRSATPGAGDDGANRLLADVRRGLAAIADVELVPPAQSRRTIWIVADRAAGVYAASLMVTERYDRETLMVIGIEDDDMAERMMALQIANDHQIFVGSDPTELARRVVAAVEGGVLARVRSRPPKP
jgi:hypothetical protein